MSHEMEKYEFGSKSIWPKPELKTTWDAMRAYDDLQRRLDGLQEFGKINGRSDHFIKNLDTLAYALGEAMFQVQVIREALTGKRGPE